MKIGLVLGGGGARGFAHIGVLRALLERGHEIVAISGCSMGGIVGAFYASGHAPDDIYGMIEGISFRHFLDFGELGGIIGGRGLTKMLAQYLPPTFEELSIPLSVTAVDVQAGKLVVLRAGDLVTALRATSALPGVLSPVRYHERYLIDGGLLNNLPIDVIRSMTLSPVVAVDVSVPPDRFLEFDAKTSWSWPSINVFKRTLTIELFLKAFDIPQALLTEMRLAMHPPELLIRPKLDPNMMVEDFERLEETVAAGYEATLLALDSFAGLTPESEGAIR